MINRLRSKESLDRLIKDYDDMFKVLGWTFGLIFLALGILLIYCLIKY